MQAAEAGQDAGPALTGGAALHIYIIISIYLLPGRAPRVRQLGQPGRGDLQLPV